MKTWLHVVAVFTVAIATAGEPYRTTRERTAKLSGEQQARVRRVRTYMDLVMFPKVSLSGVSFREAVEWVTHNTSRHAPDSVPAERRGISTVSKFREGKPELVNVSLQSATLPQVLDAICAQHDYVWCIESYALSIVPREQAPK